MSKTTKSKADRLKRRARLAYLREQIRLFREEEARLLREARLKKATPR